MAQAFINSYAPLTPVGQSLQNIAMAFFGDNPRAAEREASLVERNRAAARASDALAADREAQARAREAALAGRQQFVDNTYTSLVPADDRHAARNYITNAPVMAFEDMRQPRPGSMTPEVETQLRRAHVLGPMILASSPTSNVEQLAKAFTEVQGQEFADRTARGTMSPTRFQQLQGKRPYAIQGDTLANLAEGFIVGSTPLGQEKAVTQQTAQQENRAQAGAAGAAAGASNARRDLDVARRERVVGGTDTPLEPVAGPDGTVTLQPRNKAVGEKPGAKPKAGGATPKEPQPKFLPAGQVKAIAEAIAAEEKAGGEFDIETKRRINARATELALAKGGTFSNPAGAVQQAITEMGPMEGGKRTFLPNQPRKASNAGPTAGGKVRPAGEPAPKTSRPPNMNDQQLIEEANAAIGRGADRNKVMQRLRDMGVQVN